MKNRKLLLVVSLVLALTMSLGGTLAYLTDTDEAVNVMTLGNVDIEQYEKDAEGNTFEQNQPLYPAYYTTDAEGKVTGAISGAIDKVVSVANVGSADAYVRTLIAFEAGELSFTEFQKYIHTKFEMTETWLETPIEVKGTKYYVACVDYNKLTANTTGGNSLLQVYMDKAATNEIVAQFGNTYEIVALTQAVQVNNMPTAEAAWAASFGVFNAESAAKALGGVSAIPATTVSTVAELKAAFAKGGTVVLAADFDLAATSENNMIVAVPQGTSVVLDLNGHNINANTEAVGSNVASGVFRVEKGASLTINGDGNVYMDANDDAMNAMNAIILNNAGKVTINGGNYSVELGTTGGWDAATGAYGALIPCIVDNSSNVGDAVLTINGGTFTFDRNMIRNHCQSQQATIIINGGTFIGTDENGSLIWNHKTSSNSKQGIINITGGTFANVKVEDDWGIVSAVPSGDNVNTMAPANTADQLIEALENGKDVLLSDDIEAPAALSNGYGQTGINVKNGQTIDGNGQTLSVPGANGTWDSGINTTGGLIKNITVTGSFRGIFINHNSTHSERVVLENVIIDGTTYTISCDQGMNQGLTATNSTFNGWTSYAATIGDVKFIDCSFGEGAGYAFCRPYAPTEFVGCNFAEGYKLDARAAVTFENCTIGGVALTADNLSTLVISNIANATVK